MNYKKLILILIVALGYQMKSLSQNIFPYEIKEFQLENGLKVFIVPYISPGIVAYYTVVRAGSRNEVEPGKTGFAHFFEHMMFRGTEKYSDIEYNRVLKLLGADSNAFTTDDWTAYHIVASADALETIIDIESDRFINLKYSKEQFRTEAGAILGEYNKSAMNPFQMLNEAMQKLAFKNHTYRHTTIGFLEDIKDMPNQYEYSLQFFDRYYRPENCAIVIVGDVEYYKAKSLIEKYYGNWERGNFTPDIPKEPEQKEERVETINAPYKTLPYLYIGYKMPEFSDSNNDVAILDVIGYLLFSETSELYQKLVIDENLVDFLNGGASLNRDPSLFQILTKIKNDGDVEKVKQVIFQAIEDLKVNSVSTARLNDVKSNIKYSFAATLDNPNRIASTLSNFINLTSNPNSLNKYYRLLDQVTAEDIKLVAKKYLVPEARNIVLLSSGGK